MPTISQLTATSSVQDTDQVPVYSTDNGDARKASLSVLKTYLFNTGSFAASGANSDITSLSGLTTPLSVLQGGTGAKTADNALTNFGGTTVGKALFTAASAAAGRTALLAAASGANGDITSLSGITTPLSPAQGGTGLAAPGANGNILTSNGTIWTSSAAPAGGVTSVSGGTTGLTPNTATGGAITLAGTLVVANGGTGLNASGANGNVLTSNGTGFVSQAPAVNLALVFAIAAAL